MVVNIKGCVIILYMYRAYCLVVAPIAVTVKEYKYGTPTPLLGYLKITVNVFKRIIRIFYFWS